MDEIPKITPDMAGCWLDGAFGWKNTYRLITVAEAYGFELDEIYERPLVDKYGDAGLPAPSFDEAELIDAMAQDALEYLNDRAPAGYIFEYIANELVMLPVCQSENYEPKFEQCAHCEHVREAAYRRRQEELRQRGEEIRRHYRLEDDVRHARQYMNELRS